jgi:hypothetical protein
MNLLLVGDNWCVALEARVEGGPLRSL